MSKVNSKLLHDFNVGGIAIIEVGYSCICSLLDNFITDPHFLGAMRSYYFVQTLIRVLCLAMKILCQKFRITHLQLFVM